MREGRKKQNPSTKGKALRLYRHAGSYVAPALWRVAAGGRTRLRHLSLDTGRCRHTRDDRTRTVFWEPACPMGRRLQRANPTQSLPTQYFLNRFSVSVL